MLIKEPVFCPKCHQQVKVPDYIKSGQLKVLGNINLRCSRLYKQAGRKGKLVQCSGVVAVKVNGGEAIEVG